MGAHQPADFDPQLAEIIRQKVRRLIGHYGFKAGDAEDLEQELYMKTFQGMARHDPARIPRAAYAAGNVDRGIATIIEARKAQKRDRRKERSLEHAVELPDSNSIRQLINRIDMRDAISQLPPALQRWAWLFAEFGLVEIMAATGSTRGKVRHQWNKFVAAMRQIRPE